MMLLMTVALSGCCTFRPCPPPTQSLSMPDFPAPPDEMFQVLPKLEPVPPGAKPVDLMNNITKNYGVCRQYYNRVEVWEHWYNQKKELYDAEFKKGAKK